MTTKSPDWQLYESFLAVVREGSLSGAARVLGVTQPTLGRHVEALEAALGVRLFARSQLGLTPTGTALRLLPSAEAMAAAAEAARRAASGEAAEERGTVRITASEIMGGEVLPAMLAAFRERHAGIVIELALTNRNEDLLRGDADIAVRMARPTQGALVARRIGRVDIGLFAHRRYLKLHGTPRGLDEVRRHSLVGYDRDPTTARLLARWGVQLSREEMVFRSDSDLAQLAAIRAGMGIGGCQLGVARRDAGLVALLEKQLTLPLDMWLVMHRDLRTNRRVRLVYDHLAGELAQYARSSRRARGALPEETAP
jgi:DNA-binding transcriptional LysR family regulator